MTVSSISKLSRQLIAEGRTKEALDILLNYFKSTDDIDDDYRDNTILLSSRFNEIQKKNLLGIVSNSEYSVEINRLTNAILELTEYIDENIPPENSTIRVENSKNVIVGSSINVGGDFRIGDDIQTNEKLVESLLQKKSKIKVLFLSSNPLDTNPLRLDKEMRDIETELIRSKHRDLFEFIKFSAVRIKDLQDALLMPCLTTLQTLSIFQVMDIALLDNQTEKVQIVQSEPLSNLFKLFSNDIACVFLNSCYSKEQAVMIRKYIPNVIGMNKAVPDNTAIEFATVFYKGIAAGREIGFSFELAKNSVDLHNITGSDIPEII
jgi:Effector-associated domain 11